jgi:hypothetical protein
MNVTTVRSTAVVAGLAIAVTLAAGCSQTKEATKGAVSSASSVGSSAASSAANAAETAASSATGAPASATTLYYPTQAESVFSVDAPANWEVTQTEQFGDFTNLRSENGSAVLEFRAQNFDTEEEVKTEVESIVDGTIEFLNENYTDITLGDVTKVTYGGKPGVELTGTGMDEDGNAVKFLSTIIVLGPTSVAEIWAAAFPEGPDLAEANAVIDSFKPTSGLR